MDLIKCQMGRMISQKSRPVSYWSKKLLPAQKKKLPTIEQDLLAIVELLKEVPKNSSGAEDLCIHRP